MEDYFYEYTMELSDDFWMLKKDPGQIKVFEL